MNKARLIIFSIIACPIMATTNGCGSPGKFQINTTKDFYEFLEQSRGIADTDKRIKSITSQLSQLDDQYIINFEKFFRKELIRVCHYNIILLTELNYPTPVMLKDGKPVEMPGEPYFSTDMFLYIRCGVLLLGENAVELLLKDPNNIMTVINPPVTIDAEGLLFCARGALKIKNSKIDLDKHLDPADHYDSGNYEMSGQKIKWYDPEHEFPKLARYYNYKKKVVNMEDLNIKF